MMNNNIKGLYVHIPFCDQICPYCDFHKMVASEKLKENYIDALIKEAELKKINDYSFQTLYFGGGTPSSLNIRLLEKLLNGLSKLVSFDDLKEFTFECNPENIDENLIKVLNKYHVNRISIGVQTLNIKYQTILKRFCTYEKLKSICMLLKKYDISNYSFDLMYGMNGQSILELKEDLDLLIALNPVHLSIYSLLIEKHTIFDYMLSNGINNAASDDEQANMYYFIIDYLENNNFFQYETSNFSKKGYESKHNLIYWNDEEYIALGTGASSSIKNKRIKNTCKINSYIDSLNSGKLPLSDVEILSIEELKDEYIMMNLRKNQGICLSSFYNLFKVYLIDDYPNIDYLLKKNVLRKNLDYIMISKEYRYVANYVISLILSN